MYSLIYRSTATANLSLNDIKDIHLNAKAFNSENDITGCLLHYKNKFIQIIEGEKKVILELFKKIEEDPRHTNVKIMYVQNSPIRMFGNWSMVYNNLDTNNSTKVIPIKQNFENVFHASDAIRTPGKSKVVLWQQVNEILLS